MDEKSKVSLVLEILDGLVGNVWPGSSQAQHQSLCRAILEAGFQQPRAEDKKKEHVEMAKEPLQSYLASREKKLAQHAKLCVAFSKQLGVTPPQNDAMAKVPDNPRGSQGPSPACKEGEAEAVFGPSNSRNQCWQTTPTSPASAQRSPIRKKLDMAGAARKGSEQARGRVSLSCPKVVSLVHGCTTGSETPPELPQRPLRGARKRLSSTAADPALQPATGSTLPYFACAVPAFDETATASPMASLALGQGGTWDSSPSSETDGALWGRALGGWGGSVAVGAAATATAAASGGGSPEEISPWGLLIDAVRHQIAEDSAGEVAVAAWEEEDSARENVESTGEVEESDGEEKLSAGEEKESAGEDEDDCWVLSAEDIAQLQIKKKMKVGRDLEGSTDSGRREELGSLGVDNDVAGAQASRCTRTKKRCSQPQMQDRDKILAEELRAFRAKYTQVLNPFYAWRSREGIGYLYVGRRKNRPSYYSTVLDPMTGKRVQGCRSTSLWEVVCSTEAILFVCYPGRIQKYACLNQGMREQLTQEIPNAQAASDILNQGPGAFLVWFCGRLAAWEREGVTREPDI